VTADEDTIRRYWQEVWSEGRFDVAAQVYAPSYRENHELSTPDEFAAGAAAWAAHFTDFRADIDELFSVGHRVITRVTYRGRHTGDFKAAPARGGTYEVPGIDIFEFADGLVIQHWHSTDHLKLFLQLGAVLTPRQDGIPDG
jgi:steroid delta-isomerase-like uncharacterized protein